METVENRLLADLFPPSEAIETPAEPAEKLLNDFNLDPSTVTPTTSTSTVQSVEIKNEKVEQVKRQPEEQVINEGVYVTEVEMSEVVTKTLIGYHDIWKQKQFSTEIKAKSTDSSCQGLLILANMSHKVMIEIVRNKGSIQFRVLPPTTCGKAQEYQVISADGGKIVKELESVNLEKFCLLRPKHDEEDEDGTKRAIGFEIASVSVNEVGKDIFHIKKVIQDESRNSLKCLAEQGVRLESMTCAVLESGTRYWICPEDNCKKAYTRPSKLKIHLFAHKGKIILLDFLYLLLTFYCYFQALNLSNVLTAIVLGVS